MSTISTRPLRLVGVDFSDLYARHLCRHSQFGINLAHLLALIGVWFGVYGAIYSLVHLDWVPIVLAGAYLACVAMNAPLRVSMATAGFLGLFVYAVLSVPELPIWVYLLLIPVCYKLQSWSHKLFTLEKDMTDFNLRYPKGPIMFVLLLIYEIPLSLNYFVFGMKNWTF